MSDIKFAVLDDKTRFSLERLRQAARLNDRGVSEIQADTAAIMLATRRPKSIRLERRCQEMRDIIARLKRRA